MWQLTLVMVEFMEEVGSDIFPPALAAENNSVPDISCAEKKDLSCAEKKDLASAEKGAARGGGGGGERLRANGSARGRAPVGLEGARFEPTLILHNVFIGDF